MFVQFHIFTNTIKEMDATQKFISTAKYTS